MSTATIDKLTSTQQKVLDLVALKGAVHGVAVPDASRDDEVHLSSARALVKKGYLRQTDAVGRNAPRFVLADDDFDAGPVPHPREMKVETIAEPKTGGAMTKMAKGLRMMAKALRRQAAKSQALVHPQLAPHYVDPNRRAQMLKAKARRRAKNKVARASRRINRQRAK